MLLWLLLLCVISSIQPAIYPYMVMFIFLVKNNVYEMVTTEDVELSTHNTGIRTCNTDMHITSMQHTDTNT